MASTVMFTAKPVLRGVVRKESLSSLDLIYGGETPSGQELTESWLNVQQ